MHDGDEITCGNQPMTIQGLSLPGLSALASNPPPLTSLLPYNDTTICFTTNQLSSRNSTPLYTNKLHLLPYSDRFSLSASFPYQQHLPPETQEHSSLCQSKISRPSVSPCPSSYPSPICETDTGPEFMPEHLCCHSVAASEPTLVVPACRS